MEFPLASMQGELKVGSVTPKPKFSSSRVCFRSSPYFRLWRPVVVGDVGLHAPIQQLPVLALRGGRIGEGIAAGVVVHLIFSDIRIHRQQRVGVERVLVPGRNTPGEHALMLILGQLVVVVGYLKPVPRSEQIQVEDILAIGLIVEDDRRWSGCSRCRG